MTATSSHEVLQRRTNIGLIVAFFAFLWLPAADSFLRLDRTAAINENRAPAPFPNFQASLHGVGDFLSGLETYFNDHFGFRNRLVRWEKHWKKQIFRMRKANNALIGKDGWLYFTGGLMVDDIMGNRPFSQSELDAWRELLTHRRDWLAERGMRYLLVIPPDKHTIYPEHLPDWLANSARPPHRIEQFMNYMEANSDVPILDLRQTLLDAKKTSRVYFQTDTHWNDMGAFLAFRRITEKLDSLGIQGMPSDLSAFEVSTKDLPVGDPVGDLARMLGQENSHAETDVTFLKAKPPLDLMLSGDPPHVPSKKWSPGTEPKATDNPKKNGKLLLFRDSFATRLMPYLGQNYRRVVYAWQHNWDKNLIGLEKPDVVIDEILERFLLSRNPAELKLADETPGVQIVGD